MKRKEAVVASKIGRISGEGPSKRQVSKKRRIAEKHPKADVAMKKKSTTTKKRQKKVTKKPDIGAELDMIVGLKRGPDYLEVPCGCTSKRLGDCPGKLKIFSSGQFLINCECTEDCPERNLKPYDFQKHSMREGPVNWTHHIWVTRKDKKVPVYKTVLLDFFKLNANEVPKSCKGKQIFHRDEFIRCSKCKKERRFHRRTKEECRVYHDALASGEWKCGDPPHDE